jgi:hypothetical protein
MIIGRFKEDDHLFLRLEAAEAFLQGHTKGVIWVVAQTCLTRPNIV